MKIANSIIIATAIATFVISVFTFQPTAAEENNNAVPSATPRKVRKPIGKSAGRLKNGATKGILMTEGLGDSYRVKNSQRRSQRTLQNYKKTNKLGSGEITKRKATGKSSRIRKPQTGSSITESIGSLASGSNLMVRKSSNTKSNGAQRKVRRVRKGR